MITGPPPKFHGARDILGVFGPTVQWLTLHRPPGLGLTLWLDQSCAARLLLARSSRRWRVR